LLWFVSIHLCLFFETSPFNELQAIQTKILLLLHARAGCEWAALLGHGLVGRSLGALAQVKFVIAEILAAYSVLRNKCRNNFKFP
jgi:hypothetical protein